MSHPTWVRGLKQNNDRREHHNNVAPYVGAWIETTAAEYTDVNHQVAPYVGAWIETVVLSNCYAPC